jgi:protease I
MAKVLFVIAPQNFRDEEYFTPKKSLEEAGHTIETTSKTTGEIRGAGGGVAQVITPIAQINIDNFDGIVFVGGPGMIDFQNDPDFTQIAKKFFDAKKLVGAICVAPAILANAGILNGKKATSWSGVKETLETNGAVYTGQPVQIDGNIITADGPTSALEFGETLARALKN